MNRKKIIKQFEENFSHSPDKFLKYICKEKFIYQNANYLSPQLAIKHLKENFEKKVNIYCFEDENYVIALNIEYSLKTKISLDKFYFEDKVITLYNTSTVDFDPEVFNKIVKLKWSNLFLSKITTEINKRFAENFFRHIFFDWKFNYPDYLDPEFFLKIKRAPGGYNDIELKFLDYFKRNQIGLYYTKIVKIYGVGNLIIIESEGILPKRNNGGNIIFDLFIFKNTLISAHYKFISATHEAQIVNKQAIYS